MKILILYYILILCISQLNELRIVNNPDFVESINKREPLWEAGHNERLADMNISDVKRLLGTFKTPIGSKLPTKNISPIKNLPKNFNLREAYPTCESIREIRDQSTCGSCWAFGAAEAMSDRICIKSGGKLQIRISAENILSCCSSCGMGCNGGWPVKAWEYFHSKGIPTGGLYDDNTTCQPYVFPPCDHHVKGKYGPCSGEQPTPKCEKTCKNGANYEDDKWYSNEPYSVESDEEKIMTEIYDNGSVEASFTVFEDWLNYKSGVYHYVQGQELGGHAIKLIGWGEENINGQDVKFWIGVNSWNESWGDNGSFKILRGNNECGIEEDIVAAIPKLKHSHILNFLELFN